MAKCTIISLLLVDFVPICFKFNLFWRIFRGSFRFKKVPSSRGYQRLKNNDSFSSYEDSKDVINYCTKHGQIYHILLSCKHWVIIVVIPAFLLILNTLSQIICFQAIFDQIVVWFPTWWCQCQPHLVLGGGWFDKSTERNTHITVSYHCVIFLNILQIWRRNVSVPTVAPVCLKQA